jgi:hypothetical protein
MPKTALHWDISQIWRGLLARKVAVQAAIQVRKKLALSPRRRTASACTCDDNGVASFDLLRHHRANERIFL